MSTSIQKLTIEGYKSIRQLQDFELRPLNVLIGANGAGKSNFVSFFRLLRELVEQRLQLAVQNEGGADTLLHLGPKVTQKILAKLSFGENAYEIELTPTVDGRMVFQREAAISERVPYRPTRSFGMGHTEAKLPEHQNDSGLTAGKGILFYVFNAVSSWVVYHFYDTSATAGVRRRCAINDNERLRHDASNLAAFLYRIRQTHPPYYGRIRDVTRLAAPFFDDFKLRPIPGNEDQIQLEWTQMGTGYPFLPSQLSDGTLRFICLATALIQPEPPSTMLFDEPELGMHPYALTLVAGLFKQATQPPGKRAQVIISTQSAALLNEFVPEDVIVVERERGESIFYRLNPDRLSEWLEEYQLGELWQKNLFGGRPNREDRPRIFNPVEAKTHRDSHEQEPGAHI